MKKFDIAVLLKLLLVPALLVVLGLILVINPDAASAVVAKLLGYLLIAGSVIAGITAVFSHSGKVAKGIGAVILAMAGGWLVSHPLMLAAWIGRFLGVLIVINVIPDLIYAWKQGRNVIVFSAAAAAVGVALILLPMTASRLVFFLCGAAILVIGVLMAVDRLRSRRYLTDGDDPNIIDAL